MLFTGCKGENKIVVVKGIYYWESKADSFSKAETEIINKTGIKKLYLKLFEVSYDEELGAVPISKTNLDWFTDFDSLNVIPCIYIQNDVLSNIETKEIEELASNTFFLISKKMDELISNPIPFSEIQIDCDWTPTTKKNYFKFLEILHQKSKLKLSCTLRLYPYKYSNKMGIPPVDRVMLMCYNLLSPKNNEKKNSIFDLNEFKKYTDIAIDYPLPIDVALPKYSWNICYENTTFKGVVHGPQENLKHNLKTINPLWSILQKDTVIDNLYLRRGYRIKHETVSNETLEKLIDQLKIHTKFKDTITVTFFQLDEEEFKQTSYEELDQLYRRFNN